MANKEYKPIIDKLREENNNLWRENAELLADNERLQLEIKYQPGGEGMIDAQEDFNELMNGLKD